jgi:aminopeptidase YwaD
MSKTNTTQFSGNKAFEHVSYMAEKIGPRLTGTAGEHAAAKYIAEQFRSFGLKTKFQEFDVETFDCDAHELKVQINGKWKEIPIQPVGLSGSTPVKGMTGELYYAEYGQPEYFSPEMEGKIVLVCGRVHPQNRYKFLRHKPKAVIFIESHLTEEPMRVNLREESLEAYGHIPLGRITHLDGLEIVKHNATKAKLIMRNTAHKSHCKNVIGELKGTDHPDEIITICGHYDTSRDISGASDNAGGTAIMMELGRVLAKAGSKRTLRFVAFAGEETGLQGSRHYAGALVKKAETEKKRKSFNDKLDKTELDKHMLVYNVDVHGCILGQNNFMYSGEEDLGALVRLLSKELGIPVEVGKGAMSSDGSVLAAEGVPAIQFARNGGTSGFLHSTLDDIKYLSPDALENAGVFSEVLLRRYVTDAYALPTGRSIPEDQHKGLKTFKKPEDKSDKTKSSKKAPKKTAKKAAKKTAKPKGKK